MLTLGLLLLHRMAASPKKSAQHSRDLARVSSALVADLVASQTVQERTLCRALAEVEAEIQDATAAAWARGAAVQKKCATDDDFSMGMREDENGRVPVPAQEMKRLCRRLLAAERKANAVAVQRDALRDQLHLVQRHCNDLLAENAQVHGANAALNGMLQILSAVAESREEATPAAASSEDDTGLADILAEVYGPQYAALRHGEASAASAEGGGKGSAAPSLQRVPSTVRIRVDAKAVRASGPGSRSKAHRRHVSEGQISNR